MLSWNSGERARITFDITTLTSDEMETTGRYKIKSDVVIFWPKEGLSGKDPEDQEEWQKKVDEIVDSSITILREKSEERGAVMRPLGQYEIEESRRLLAEADKRELVRSQNSERLRERQHHRSAQRRHAG